MIDIKETDWKLFKELFPLWQERFISSLLGEYILLLKKEEQPSSRFWELYKRINNDKRKSGVIVNDLRRSNIEAIIISLIEEGVITSDDLLSFSNEFKMTINELLKAYE